MKMQEITESFLQAVAGDIEKLLLEDRENIDFAYKKIRTGLKLSLGITLDPVADGIIVNYNFGFDLEPKPEPPEKHSIKFKHTYSEGQMAMEFLGKEIREGR
jgi:hypothetical protein